MYLKYHAEFIFVIQQPHVCSHPSAKRLSEGGRCFLSVNTQMEFKREMNSSAKTLNWF